MPPRFQLQQQSQKQIDAIKTRQKLKNLLGGAVDFDENSFSQDSSEESNTLQTIFKSAVKATELTLPGISKKGSIEREIRVNIVKTGSVLIPKEVQLKVTGTLNTYREKLSARSHNEHSKTLLRQKEKVSPFVKTDCDEIKTTVMSPRFNSNMPPSTHPEIGKQKSESNLVYDHKPDLLSPKFL